MPSVQTFAFNPFSENTHVLWDETGACVVIDPGCMTRVERMELAAFLRDNRLELTYVLNTHCHIDHVFGNHWMVQEYQVPLVANRKDLPNLRGAIHYSQMVGLPFDPSPEPDIHVEAGDVVKFGNTTLEVLFTPGHAPGHVSFLHRGDKQVFSGDVLFQQSIGRTDLPGGDYDELMESILTQLMPLPDDIRVYSGHGPITTIGAERKSNPFILEYLNNRVQRR